MINMVKPQVQSPPPAKKEMGEEQEKGGERKEPSADTPMSNKLGKLLTADL